MAKLKYRISFSQCKPKFNKCLFGVCETIRKYGLNCASSENYFHWKCTDFVCMWGCESVGQSIHSTVELCNVSYHWISLVANLWSDTNAYVRKWPTHWHVLICFIVNLRAWASIHKCICDLPEVDFFIIKAKFQKTNKQTNKQVGKCHVNNSNGGWKNNGRKYAWIVEENENNRWSWHFFACKRTQSCLQSHFEWGKNRFANIHRKIACQHDLYGNWQTWPTKSGLCNTAFTRIQ